MSEIAVLERRRRALLKIAELQRCNVAARWQNLQQRRSVRWVDAAFASLRQPGGYRASAARQGVATWASLLTGGLGTVVRSGPGLAATALRILRRPTWISAALMVARWWWERHERRQAEAQRIARGRFRRLRA